jgi:hypothetical protein
MMWVRRHSSIKPFNILRPRSRSRQCHRDEQFGSDLEAGSYKGTLYIRRSSLSGGHAFKCRGYNAIDERG